MIDFVFLIIGLVMMHLSYKDLKNANNFWHGFIEFIFVFIGLIVFINSLNKIFL